MWERVKGPAKEWASTPFRVRNLRTSFVQMCKDGSAGIEAVSGALRHRAGRTTELCHTGVSSEREFRELEDVFSSTRRKSGNGDVVATFEPADAHVTRL